MDIKDWIGFLITFAGMAYGFGRLASETGRNRKDIDRIGDLHRETIHRLGEIDKKLERIDQRIVHLEK